jgi:short-subunit dehydrogenase
LALVARREAALGAVGEAARRAHGVDVTVCVADLRDPAAPDAILARLGPAADRISVLVNNAGFGIAGAVVETPIAPIMDMLRVNIEALVALTMRIAPGMARRGAGRIMNVASTAAFFPGPYMAAYYASKAFVLSYSEGLAEELAGTGVTVTALCPGPTTTEFAAVAGSDQTRLFKRGAIMRPDDVARIGVRGLVAGRRVVVPGLVNQLLVQTVRVSPRRVLARIAARLNRPAV